MAAVACIGGCATVDPKPDFEQAGRIVAERTGVAEVFDPTAEVFVDGKLRGLLENGLTVEEAVQVSLLNNREFQAVFDDIGVSRAEVAQSALLSNPTMALGFNFPEGGGLVDVTLGVAQQVADLWQIPIRRRLAEAQLERTILSAGRVAVQLAGQVRAKCYEVLALERAAELADDNVRLADKVVQVARRQFEAGQVGEFDVNVTRTRLLDVHAGRISSRGALEIARAELANLLGLSRDDQAWQLVDTLPETSPPVADTDSLLMSALDRRLDARIAELDVQSSEDELERQFRRVFPDVQVGFNLERNDRRALPGRNVLADTARESVAAGQLTAPSIESRGQRALARRQIIDAKLGPSLALTLPVWDQNQAQIAKARIQAVQSRRRYEGVLDRIALEVRTAASAARTSADLVRFHREESIPLAEKTVDGATRLYEAGAEDVLVLVNAQETLVARRQAWVQALRENAIAGARLESAVGGRLPENTPVESEEKLDDAAKGTEKP